MCLFLRDGGGDNHNGREDVRDGGVDRRNVHEDARDGGIDERNAPEFPRGGGGDRRTEHIRAIARRSGAWTRGTLRPAIHALA